MKTIQQPPGKRANKNKPPANAADRKDPREAKEITGGEDRESSDKPSEEEVISHWVNPVTNQDEQEKITNSGADDIPIANK